MQTLHANSLHRILMRLLAHATMANCNAALGFLNPTIRGITKTKLGQQTAQFFGERHAKRK